MRAVWLVLAAGFRRQWRSWLLLGLLIVVLAACALLAADALAAVPAMSAARSRPGPLLRTG